MRKLVSGLSLALVGSLQLAGCAGSDSGPAEDCLPGDIECSSGGGDGKSDGFDYKNDPERMSQNLNYRLDELPRNGKLTSPVWKDKFPEAVGKVPVAWTDTYWPTYQGSHNARWLGPTVKSPMEKYDAAFNGAAGCETQPEAICGFGAKAAWDTYYGCAGPAASWQSQYFQDAGIMHDGIDNNYDGLVDECEGDEGADGIATWWGTCHAWTPASLSVPEPQRAVTVNGVTFEVADIKALAQNIYDQADAVMLGGRCNSQHITHDVNGSANDDCADVNPGALHVILANFLGIAQLPLIEDRTANFEVWNQPVVAYDVLTQTETTPEAANICVGNTGSTWTYNPEAVQLFDVSTTVSYITEGRASARPLGFEPNYIRRDRYHYILEVGATGKVIGGRFCQDSANTHVDFLWSPTGEFQPSNPNIDKALVLDLIAKSVAPE
ncbi:MAG: hypothetical protein AB7O24_18355 [Kofleriaceae bacterium]